MGKVLQIRVMAQTFDETEVRDNWPKLSKMVWGEDPPKREHGVLELARALDGHQRMGMLPDEMQQHKEALEAGEKFVQAIEKALGDWKPGDADKLSNELEDHLEALEKNIEMV